MTFYPLSLIGILLLSCIIQQFLPAFSAWHDARILLLPLVVLCSSVTVSTAFMLVITFVGGFLWDSQQVLILQQGDELVYHSSLDNLKFGYSIILYALMGFLMQGIRPLFKQGNRFLSIILTGIAIFLYLFVEYLLRGFFIGGFSFDNGIIEQIAATSVLTMMISPLIFWMLIKVAKLTGHKMSGRK